MRLCKCRECRKELKQKPNENNRDYMARLYCGSSCQARERHLKAVDVHGERFCEQCNKQLKRKPKEQLRSYSKRRFCSHRCANKAKATPDGECEHCGVVFKRKRRETRFCSRACRGAFVRAMNLRDLPERCCEHCGDVLVKPANVAIKDFLRKRFCCRECYLRSRYRVHEKVRSKHCVECGEVFHAVGVSLSSFAKRKFCSQACASVARRRSNVRSKAKQRKERGVTQGASVSVFVPPSDTPEFYAPPPPRLEGAPECSVEGCCDTANPWTGKCSRHSISRPSFDDVDLFEERTMVACV